MSAADHFKRDIAKHEMQVIRDDGVNRHIRFKRPGTMCMHFDLLTWPGYLCYTGDMGTYVFRRLHDMFQFFRRFENYPPYRMDLRYWAEKLEACDRGDGFEAFSSDAFRAAVKVYFDQATEGDDWTDERKASLWEEINNDVLESFYGEHEAFLALRDFRHDGFQFIDWEFDCKEYTPRFLWCCHALEWAICTYDAAKGKEP
ncbi:MAG: hypothetical protein KKH74_01905 [Gammaproteobacteria bacterium]|nr:hypothetical protein [Gammaproteobacteria bacterium]MBU1731002.1 hypothetical protein [Gammaproteobacteria bacterium]MBU1893662.1 hypothetical protein [Gammaproteobacteria bacterium]